MLTSRLFCALSLLTLGLTTAGIWTDVVGYSVNLFVVDTASGEGTFSGDAFLWGRFFTGLVILVFARFIPRIQTTLTILVAVTMSIATATLIFSYHQTLLDPFLFSSIAVFVAGGGYIFLVSIFYILFAQRIQTSQVVICIALSLILETVLSILVSLYLSATVQAIIVTLAPLLVIILYFSGERLSRSSSDKSLQDTTAVLGEPQKKVAGLSKNILLVQVVIFSSLLVLIRALSNIGIWGRSRTNFTGMTELSVDELIVISLIVLLLSFLVFILPQKRFSLVTRCLISFIVLLAGLQVLAITDDHQLPYVFDAMTTAIELFAHLSYWMMVIACIRDTDFPPFFVASIARPFYALISLAWLHYIEDLPFMTSTVVMVIIYALLVAVLIMVFSGRILGNLSSLHIQEDAQQRIRQRKLDSFETKWRLSKRESEIFELLLAGKKRTMIEAECGLSEGTVKTHISNIYRKLDVHSKNEMVDLFEGYEDSEIPGASGDQDDPLRPSGSSTRDQNQA